MTNMPPPPAAPQVDGARPCAVCGQTALQSMAFPIHRKRRVKFGVFWLLFTVFTGGLALLLYLVWPRTTEVIGWDRYLQCAACNSRQT